MNACAFNLGMLSRVSIVKGFVALALIFAGLSGFADEPEWIGFPLPGTTPGMKITASGYYRVTNEVLTSTIEIGGAAGTNVVLDLNGCTITNFSERAIYVTGGATIDITNMSSKVAYIEGGKKATKRGIVLKTNAKAKVSIGGPIVIEWCYAADGGGIYNYCGNEVHLYDGVEIRWCGNCDGGYGGGIYNTGEEQSKIETLFYMHGGSVVSNNTVKMGKFGGGVFNGYGGHFMMDGGIVSYNGMTNGQYFGGGLANYHSSKMEIFGNAEVSHNMAGVGGGIESGTSSVLSIRDNALFAFNEVNYGHGDDNPFGGGALALGKNSDGGKTNYLYMTGGRVVSNRCVRCVGGGGVFMRGTGSSVGFISIENAVIKDNFTDTFGGGIYSQGWVFIHDSDCSGNVAMQEGGGVYVKIPNQTMDFSMNSCVVTNNLSGGSGGGLYVEAAKNLTLDGSLFSGNVATNDGGGVCLVSSDMAITNAVRLADNRAVNGRGGAVAALNKQSAAHTLRISDGDIVGNTAIDGGGLYLTNEVLRASGGNIVGNTAAQRGGGICISEDKSGTAGRGRAYFSGTVNISDNGAEWFGGGVALNKKALLQISNGQIAGNTARMGGGVYLIGGAILDLLAGDIRENEAKCYPGDEQNPAFGPWDQTAYHSVAGQIRPGVGGALYVDSGASAKEMSCFYCTNTTPGQYVGIFENLADRAGDDVVCSGLFTQMTRPTKAVYGKDGKLLDWFEDYYDDDAMYSQRFNGKSGYQDTEAIRYREAVTKGKQVSIDNESLTTANNYLCMTLGYEVGILKDLWITDHELAEDGHMYLAFKPTFQDEDISVRNWILSADKNKSIKYATATNEAELAVACKSPQDIECLREWDHGTNDADRLGWCWVKMPVINEANSDSADYRLWKIIIDTDVPIPPPEPPTGTQLVYIASASAGGAYFDLGIKPDPYGSVRLGYRFMGGLPDSKSFRELYCTTNASGQSSQGMFSLRASGTGKYDFCYGAMTNALDKATDTRAHTNVLSAVTGVWMDGVKLTSTPELVSQEFEVESNLHLLGCNPQTKTYARVYFVQVYDRDGKLLLDAWPWKAADGTVGLYDFKGRRFIPPAEDGTTVTGQ